MSYALAAAPHPAFGHPYRGNKAGFLASFFGCGSAALRFFAIAAIIPHHT